MDSAKNKQQDAKKDASRIFSEVLDSGAIIEALLCSNKTGFAISEDGVVREEERLRVDGRRMAPYSPTNNLLTHEVVLLPSGVGEYSSVRQLVAEVRAFIRRYVDLPPSFERIATHYVLFTWIYDDFNEVPYLRVRGDYGSGKSRFLLTVGSLCYKPIFASGASSVSPIFRILDAVAGTLVVDEGDFRASDEKAEIVKILNNGNARGFPVLRSEATPAKEFNPRAFRVFGPKLIGTRGFFEDRALESRCITHQMGSGRLRGDIPLNLPHCFRQEAQALRNKLLMFRFKNLGKERDLAVCIDRSIEPRISQIFAPLVSTIEDTATQSELLELARSYSADLVAERGLDVAAQVLKAIVVVLHTRLPLSLSLIAQEFGHLFSGEYPEGVAPRWIGGILRKQLGLKPMKSNGLYVIPKTEYGQIRILCERYGVEMKDTRDERDVTEAPESKHAAGVA